MKKTILASLAVAAVLASCTKEAEVDPTIASTQSSIQFSTYAGSAVETKANPVTTNALFGSELGSFDVSAYFTASAVSTTNIGKYFSFNKVSYVAATISPDAAAYWSNDGDMYWPNENGTLYFGGYAPSDAVSDEAYTYDSSDGHSLTFDYTVADIVADQVDLMYTISDLAYTNGTTEKAPLHFKHALSQIAFTATKDDDIDVTVSEIQICNVVDNGSFKATTLTNYAYSTALITADQESAAVNTTNFGSWTPAAAAAQDAGGGETTNLENYAVDMNSASVSVADDENATTLTDANDALILLPQTLTAWSTASTSEYGTGSYLAIKCQIKHAGATAYIIDGYVFVPFDTTWDPGYKYTYNLDFGGGYTGPTTVPDPGEVPTKDDVVETLRPIVYTVTVDEWVPATPTSAVVLDTESE